MLDVFRTEDVRILMEKLDGKGRLYIEDEKCHLVVILATVFVWNLWIFYFHVWNFLDCFVRSLTFFLRLG